MVAVWNQRVNPWGATGGNPMVKVNYRGRDMWSFYKYPSSYPVIDNYGTTPLPNPVYNNAWNAMYTYYVDQKGHPVFDMNANGYTLGNPEVPGFTYNNTSVVNPFEYAVAGRIVDPPLPVVP